MPKLPPRSHSAVVSLPRQLHDEVLSLSEAHAVPPSALAQTGLMLVRARPDQARPDPGPGAFERVQVVSASGRARTQRILPRLRLRLLTVVPLQDIRVALATMAQLASSAPADAVLEVQAAMISQQAQTAAELSRLREEAARLRAAIATLAPRLLPQPPRTPQQSAWILGLASEWGLDAVAINARYRQLALLFHPDIGVCPDHERMIQLNAAKTILLRQLKS
jgi:hypothetical protein